MTSGVSARDQAVTQEAAWCLDLLAKLKRSIDLKQICADNRENTFNFTSHWQSTLI